MNKKELQARAKELGVDFVTRDPVSVLEAKIAEAERANTEALGGAVADVLGGADSVETADALVAERKARAKPKAPRGAKKPPPKKATPADTNPAVVKLIEAIGTGDFVLALEDAHLTPSGLGRQLGVEPAVVSKLASGIRVPQANASAHSVAGQVATWFVSVTKKTRKAATR